MGFLEEEAWKLRPDRRRKQEQPEVGRGEALHVEAAADAKTWPGVRMSCRKTAGPGGDF